MSSPYVFNPENSLAYYQPTAYVNPYFLSAQNSPFLPPTSLLNTSPYGANIPLPGVGAPNTPNRIYFPSTPASPYQATWNIPLRERRPSWHGAVAPSSPFGPSIQVLPPANRATYFTRRHSFNNAGSGWSPSPYTGLLSPYGPQTAQLLQVHPWLNAENPQNNLMLDLALPNFSPMRLVAPGQPIPLTLADVQEHAFYPPLTRLRIVCDLIPQWPVELEYAPGNGFDAGAPPPPITVGDVLLAVHQLLHQRITHLDWATLTPSQEHAVSKAYTRRCRAVPNLEILQRNEGVKKVDFLLGRVMFRGLLRADGWDGNRTMKLVVA